MYKKADEMFLNMATASDARSFNLCKVVNYVDFFSQTEKTFNMNIKLLKIHSNF